MRGYYFFSWIRGTVATLICLGVFCAVCALNYSAFPLYGGKEYYLYSASSGAEITREVSLADLPFLKGERACVETTDGNRVLEETLARYNAEILRTETGEFGVSYYCYSPKLKNGLILEGKTINLHIVVKTGEVLLGTPIIFGGY